MAEKHKSRKRITSHCEQFQWPTGGAFPTSPVIQATAMEKEVILYTTDKSRKRPNRCEHLKVTTSVVPLSYTSTPFAFDGSGIPFEARNLVLFGSWMDLRSFDFAIPPAPAYGDIEQRFKGTNSAPQLLNFFAELAGMRTLVKTALAQAKALAKSKSLLKRRFVHDSAYRRTKRGSRSASKRYLEYNFGVAPAVSDVQKALDRAWKLGDRLVELMANSSTGTPEVMTWTTKSKSNFSENRSDSYCQTRVDFTVDTTIQRFICARYSLFSEPRYIRDLTYFISGLGLDNVVSASWEAIPFSFVVDWLFPIGDFLESIEPDAFAFKSFDIIDHYLQVKQRATSKETVIQDGYTSTRAFAGRTVSTGKYENFFRYPDLGGIRASTPYGSGSGLNAGKLTSVGALAGARLK